MNATGQSAMNFPDMTVIDPTLHLMTIDDVMSAKFLRITDSDLKIMENDYRKYGSFEAGLLPDIAFWMDTIRERFEIGNKRNFTATMVRYAIAYHQSIYHQDLKALKIMRNESAWNGKWKEGSKKFKGCKSHFFEKLPDGEERERCTVYGHTRQTIAPLSEHADFFRISTSELTNVILCEVIARWDKLPSDAKPFFEDTSKKFSEYSIRFLQPI